MSLNNDSDEFFNKALNVYSNRDINAYYEHLAELSEIIGEEEAIGSLSRFLLSLAIQSGSKIVVECDLGTVKLSPSELPTRH